MPTNNMIADGKSVSHMLLQKMAKSNSHTSNISHLSRIGPLVAPQPRNILPPVPQNIYVTSSLIQHLNPSQQMMQRNHSSRRDLLSLRQSGGGSSRRMLHDRSSYLQTGYSRNSVSSKVSAPAGSVRDTSVRGSFHGGVQAP